MFEFNVQKRAIFQEKIQPNHNFHGADKQFQYSLDFVRKSRNDEQRTIFLSRSFHSHCFGFVPAFTYSFLVEPIQALSCSSLVHKSLVRLFFSSTKWNFFYLNYPLRYVRSVEKTKSQLKTITLFIIQLLCSSSIIILVPMAWLRFLSIRFYLVYSNSN